MFFSPGLFWHVNCAMCCLNSKYFWHVAFAAYQFKHTTFWQNQYTLIILQEVQKEAMKCSSTVDFTNCCQLVCHFCDKLQEPVKHWSSYDIIYVVRDKLLIRKAKQIIISCHFLLWTIQLHLCNCCVRATSSARVLTNTSQLWIFSATALHLIFLLVCAHSPSFYWSGVICPTS